ncbi:Pep1 protein [Candida orthopsilosis Co 90-125]|uniref:Pep1 protein n=1 Tax=Candida orthopsilosis (strain 90-125) TaxID=1136231 RepID=H8X4T8_CANO9|nr:Pep1 protein [Candida orthopsilosis Co 90-125]CCG23030.1 Pep1 protein [Candida orthopsilosis Co 90-125]
MKYTSILLILYSWCSIIHAFTPEISVTESDSISRLIRYFDDSSNILILRDRKALISFDDGKSFDPVKGIEEAVVSIHFDPFVKSRAFILTMTKHHYMTNDKGESWSKFTSDVYEFDGNGMASESKLEFNAADPNLILMSNYQCPDEEYNHKCEHVFHYTRDGFKTASKKLPINAHVCRFSRATKESEIANTETIYCSENELNSYKHIVKSRLYKSDDFFKNRKEFDLTETGNGAIIDIKVEENFMTVVMRNDKFNEKSKVDMYVSKDGKDFLKADLQVDLKYGVMSFHSSSPSSLFLSTMAYGRGLSRASKLFRSDSLGLHFTEVLDNIASDVVLKVENIDGAWLADIQVESEEDEPKSLLDIIFGGGKSKDLITKYSYNDGDDWVPLKSNSDDCKLEDGCSVHLWSFSELGGKGKFITGPTPGILVGVGTEGKHLSHDFSEMKTFVSRDGGYSWDLALETACVFSFGDQGNVIIAMPYSGVKKTDPVNYFHYSLNQGKDWETVEIKDAVYILDFVTTVDGSSRKFLIHGIKPNFHNGEDRELLYHVDFSKAYNGRTCKDSDFEEVYARQIPDNVRLCVYGHKEKFRRRKQDAECFVNKLFEDVRVYEEPCQCIEQDFECALGFKPSGKGGNKCVPDPRMISKLCESQSKDILEIYDKSKINGNLCELRNKKLEDFASKEKLKCADYSKPKDGPSGDTQEIKVTSSDFEGKLSQYAYLGNTENNIADNVVMKTNEESVWVSNNGGVSFVKAPIHDKILGFYTGSIPGQIALVSDSDVLYYSQDGGETFLKFGTPNKFVPVVKKTVAFHKTDASKYLWLGGNCDSGDSNCKASAYMTSNYGESFKNILDQVVSCDYVGPFFKKPVENLIFCTKMESDGKKSLYSIDGSKSAQKIYDDVVGYAVSDKYVVAAVVKDGSLEAKVTVDGKIFADADFPKDLKVEPHQAYTVLDSSSGSIFMHVTTSSQNGFEYGSLLKSNSNGTYFVLALDNVNRNEDGFVDFDRIDGLEGTILANIVSNYKDGKGPKKLQTLISRNDGSEWDYLVPPTVDSNGEKYGCIGSSLENCALHLHGFTERADYRDTYSSGSAIGFLIGVGNVGEYLSDIASASTFLSTDGGVTWREVKKGVYQWEYGDQGTILVLVDGVGETDKFFYSLDEGKNWNEYKFADKPVKILDLATVPTDTSRKFIIFADHPKDTRDTLSYSIDFTNIYKRQCQLDLDHPDSDDYEYWSPSHPNTADKCLFGHESKYLRRAIGHHDCFIGGAPLTEGYKVTKNCSCTRRDYECDYNYYRDTKDNTCKLVAGLSSNDRKKDMCSKPGAFQYFDSTGYRKIPLSTCEGGKQYDTYSPHACPGKEKEFNEFYGREVKGSKLFFVILIPLIVFIGATWFVYDRGVRRNGGFERLGQIRLNDQDFDDGFNPIENNQVDAVVNKIVKGGVYTAAVIFATFKTVQKVDRMVLEKIGNVVFRRNPGARNYVSIPDEDDDLFGDFDDNVDEELAQGARLSQEQYDRDVFTDDFVYDDDLEDLGSNVDIGANGSRSEEGGDDDHDKKSKASDNERLFDIEDEDDIDDRVSSKGDDESGSK